MPIYLLLAVGLFALAGCQIDGPSEKSNAKIRFTASARPATKTVYGAFYSPDESTTNTWQSIDWVNGDQIRVYSDNAVRRVGAESGIVEPNLYHWADYSVTGATAGTSPNALSTAYLENLINDGNGLGNGLYWGDAPTAKFFAIYPKPNYEVEEGPGTSIDGVSGKLYGYILEEQAPTSDGKTNMNYAVMTAAASGSKPDVDNVSNVILSFDPAFTAFEISLKSDSAEPITLTKFELIATSSAPAIAGAFTVTHDADLKRSITCGGSGRTITYYFPTNTTVSSSSSQTFTVFALPQLNTPLTGLTIRFTLGNGETRSLPLKSNGNYVNFAGGVKHRILGVVMPSSLGNFKTITLDPVAGKWIDVDIDSDTDNVPEATQFVVTGANNGRYTTSGNPAQATMEGRNDKNYRQYWLFEDDATVTVTFKIMAPEGGTWSIEKAGNDANKFTVTIPTSTGGTTETLTGSIASKPTSSSIPLKPTVVTLTITRNPENHTANSEAVLYLKTYVTDKNNVTYSIDSETQLLDMRGYHYFVLNNHNTVR